LLVEKDVGVFQIRNHLVGGFGSQFRRQVKKPYVGIKPRAEEEGNRNSALRKTQGDGNHCIGGVHAPEAALPATAS
ncbi:hypothetical protein, partial [Mesorhizobium sp.]|uniref:hypothetical protein n=1 Tax=Mesorhizobium sp. TaxID=1871066 RepID=UPI0025FF2E05